MLMLKIFVDTLGPPEKYQKNLSERFPGIQFHVKSKADSLYPIVSAASIMAKVTRDYELAMWAHRTQLTSAETKLQVDFIVGSGYPSDPITRSWLKRNFSLPFAYPDTLVRFSWATVISILKENNITWYMNN